MRSEWEKARMLGFAARGTIATLLQAGYVLSKSDIGDIFARYGLNPSNAELNFLNLVDFRPEHLKTRIGIRVKRSSFWSPCLFWDTQHYRKYETAYRSYAKGFDEVHDFLKKLLYI